MGSGYPDNAALPLLFTNGFAHEESKATVLDVCLNRTNHINVKRVASNRVSLARVGDVVHAFFQGELEAKLADLFGELVKLRSSLQTAPVSPAFLMEPMREHCSDHVMSCCEIISDCCHDLLSLSLMVPTIPWVSM